MAQSIFSNIPNISHWRERVDLAAAFRWAARLDLHEGVANHFSLAVNDSGTKFLMNPNQMHFARIRASDLLEIDAEDPRTMEGPHAPDPTAWGLHGAIHRLQPHARCAMHTHSRAATILSCLADSRLPPIDQNAAMFFDRQVVDTHYGGLALEEEAERCAAMLDNPKHTVLVMGNHGIMVIGATVAQAFERMYYFERAAAVYIGALQTSQPLRMLSDEVAAKTADELEAYEGGDVRHLAELRKILDAEGSNYAS